MTTHIMDLVINNDTFPVLFCHLVSTSIGLHMHIGIINAHKR